jgi:hypothetical protein
MLHELHGLLLNLKELSLMFTHVNRSKWLICLLAVLMFAGGCASGKSGRKLKRGKPIPCPVKDC